MLKNPLLYRQTILYFFLTWLVWVILYFVLITEILVLSPDKAIIDSLISNTLLAASAFFLANTLRFYHPKTFVYLFALGSAGIMSMVWMLIDRWVLKQYYDEYLFHMAVENLFVTRYCWAFLVHSGIIVLGLLWNKMGEQEAKQRRKEETENMVKEAELFKLRQQLQPHFLFNSLNSINALIGIKPQEARNMVNSLSEFLRGTIRREDKQLISLEEELEYLQLYLDIEKVRFGHRLNTEIAASDEALVARMPPLLLQPLMENAIKFGLYGVTGEVKITLNAQLEDRYLNIAISNPYDSDFQSGTGGTGFGLKSIKRRLYLLYARNDLLEMFKENSTFTVNLKIPRYAESPDH